MQDGLALILLGLGSAAVLIGVLGVWRLPDLFTRLHAAGVIDTLAAILILTGLGLQASSPWVFIKLAIILFFVLFTSPVATHALARFTLHASHGEQQPGGLPPQQPQPPQPPQPQ